MADHEIHFGDMEQTHRRQHLPPNRNQQYAVAVCGRPGANDLRVFVDLDALRDMETHALSDTHVELGGVLLGGQYEDQDGEPFVVVQDSLRARHYQATRGSFKFTHDTWSEITRRRDEFPADLHMIGWYHTHPDWGVFLSGMDLFICDHFFNRALDVALVIDPCRGDRGWFQWTGRTDDRIRRTGGYYVYTSRHRGAELELFAAHLENKPMTTNDPRLGGFPATLTPYPATAGSGYDARQPWFALAVTGMLATQFLLLALLAWRLLAPGPDAIAESRPVGQAAAGDSDRQTAGDLAAESRSREIRAQLRVLDRVVDELADGTPGNLVQRLEEAERENETLKMDARVYRSLEARVATENDALTRMLDAAKADQLRASDRIDQLQTTISEQELVARQSERENAALRRELKTLQESGGDVGLAAQFKDPQSWLWAAAGAVVGALAVVGLIVFRSRPDDGGTFADRDQEKRQVGREDGKDSFDETNNESDDRAPQ